LSASREAGGGAKEKGIKFGRKPILTLRQRRETRARLDAVCICILL
jgi:hypothetical protein